MTFDEDEARFELLRDEMAAYRASMTSRVGNAERLRGWCITVVVASVGFALKEGDRTIAVVGLLAVACFFMLEANQRAGNLRELSRLKHREKQVRESDCLRDLLRAGELPHSVHERQLFGPRLMDAIRAACRPAMLLLYGGTALVLGVVALALS